jgi:hypothetical protein
MPCSEEETKSGQLYIRYKAADTGNRPIDPCTGYWLSPDIWLDGGVDATTARVGAVNTVKVRVANKSSQPISSVNVQVWVCDFTLGVSPASAIAPEMTGFVSQIDPGAANAATIACSPGWTPTPADALLNGGHVCLAANCYAEEPADGTAIPPGVFKFCCDSHHGQRNIAVKTVSKIKNLKVLEFPMFIANPTPRRLTPPEFRKGQPFTVRVQHLDHGGGFEPEIKDHLASHPCARLRFRPSELKPKAFSLSGRGLKCAKGADEGQIVIAPGKRKPVVFRAAFSLEELTGNVHVFDLVQKDLKGEVVGGATVVAVIVP